MPFRFAFSTNAYTKHPLEDALADLARIGYPAVEILADRPHLDPMKIHPAGVTALRRRLESYTLALSNLNANTAHALHSRTPVEALHFEPSFTSPEPESRRARIAYTLRALEVAADLACPAVSITTGRRSPDEPLPLQMDRLKRSLTPLLKRAEALGVRIGLEYEPGLVLERGLEQVELLREIPNPFLGANLDLGHAWVVEDDLSLVLPGLKGRIWNCHLEDIKNRVHAHLIPGEGDLAFDLVKKELEAIGYDSFLTAELYPYVDRPAYAAEKALAFLRERF